MKKAIVVSGGGSKGAYAVGAIERFTRNLTSMPYSVFVGTSTGALMAPFLALDRLDTLVDIYQNTRTPQVIKEKSSTSILNQSSLYSTAPLKKLIDRHLTDAECEKLIRSRSKEVYLLTACLQTKKLTIFSTKNLPAHKSPYYDVIKLKNAAQFKRAMLASANQPVFMPPIRVNQDIDDPVLKERQYVDGGVLEYAGIEAAIDCGCEEIWTIYLSALQDQTSTKKYSKLFDMLGPTLGILTGNVGFHDLRVPLQHNKTLEYIRTVKQQLEDAGVASTTIDQAFAIAIEDAPFDLNKDPHTIHIIRPSEVLKSGTNGLEFNPDEMRVMFKLGQDDAEHYLNQLTTVT